MAAVNIQLNKTTGKKYLMDDALDLVALGTLADIVPLLGQNRILARGGLARMALNPRPGIATLKKACMIDPASKISCREVVFRLAPRLNAAGRMNHANLALNLLRSHDYNEADSLARELEEYNNERKKEENRIYEEAKNQAANLSSQKSYSSLVLYGENWHPGIVGIVASRIVDHFHKPTFVMGNDDGMVKGSGRSIENFNLYEALEQVAQYLAGFGGHSQAAGVRLAPENLEKFRSAFDDVTKEKLTRIGSSSSLLLDGELDFEQARDQRFLRELELMQPFGPGNEEPLFASPPLKVLRCRRIGNTREHVRLDLKDLKSGVISNAKAWRMANLFPDDIVHKTIKLAYTPRLDFYNGNFNPDINIKEWKIWRED